MIDRVVSCLNNRLVGINSPRLLHEMFHYVRIPNTTSYEAETGNDDAVMAFMIAVVTLYLTDPAAFDAPRDLVVPKPTAKRETPENIFYDRFDPRVVGNIRTVAEFPTWSLPNSRIGAPHA